MLHPSSAAWLLATAGGCRVWPAVAMERAHPLPLVRQTVQSAMRRRLEASNTPPHSSVPNSERRLAIARPGGVLRHLPQLAQAVRCRAPKAVSAGDRTRRCSKLELAPRPRFLAVGTVPSASARANMSAPHSVQIAMPKLSPTQTRADAMRATIEPGQRSREGSPACMASSVSSPLLPPQLLTILNTATGRQLLCGCTGARPAVLRVRRPSWHMTHVHDLSYAPPCPDLSFSCSPIRACGRQCGNTNSGEEKGELQRNNLKPRRDKRLFAPSCSSSSEPACRGRQHTASAAGVWGAAAAGIGPNGQRTWQHTHTHNVRSPRPAGSTKSNHTPALSAPSNGTAHAMQFVAHKTAHSIVPQGIDCGGPAAEIMNEI